MERRKKIICGAGCKPGNTVGRGGRNKEEIDRLRHKNMVERPLEVCAGMRAFEKVNIDFVAGQGSKRQGSNELRCTFCHQHRHVDATILQTTYNLCCLITRDASADAKR